MKKLIRVGSRESKLAMAQSQLVIDGIKERFPGYEFEIVGIRTKGDAQLDTRLDTAGGKGLFIKELENELIRGNIDIAVHSMKDMPAQLPGELTIAAVSKREDPRDVLVTADGRKLDQLEPGEVVGTSSLRREVQLLEKRPDLKVKLLRGNVLTRINRLLNGEYDAIMLAAAGLNRLGMGGRCVQFFDVKDIIPAVGQGILAVEARKNDDIKYLLESVHCEKSAQCLMAERAFMIRLNGGCTTPIAAHAVIDGDKMTVYGMLADENGSCVRRAQVEGSKREAALLGEELAAKVSK